KRDQTVAALPGLIEAIREEGYQIVSLSTLLEKSRSDLMPPLTERERYMVWADDVFFRIGHYSILLLRWAVLIGVVFGVLRFVFYAIMALAQRSLERRTRYAWQGPIDVIIPAYNEEK